MKKIIFFLAVIFSLTASAQEVATQSVSTKYQWYFAGQTLSVDNAGNKTISTKWVEKDSLSGVVIKTDVFTHSDTAFNSYWDAYDGFSFLVKELATAEHLNTATSAALEASFYNKHVSRPANGVRIPAKK